MNYNIRLYVISLIIYWCSLGGGTQNVSRVIRQVDDQSRNSGQCQTDDFPCVTGGCIDTADVCNGIAQCSDGSDESPIACGCGISAEGVASRTAINAPGVRNAQLGAHPWHVGVYRIRSNNHHSLLCVGALIYDDIVLTSANCVFDPETYQTFKASSIHVGAGKLKRDLIVEETFQQQFTAHKITILDRYEGDTKGYARNLAIIKLDRKSQRTSFVRPICLWMSRSFPSGIKHGTITGWGLQFSGNYATNLREAYVRLMDIGNCVQTFYDALYKRFLTNDKFCLPFDQGVGLKDDDTGGPVTIFYEGRHYLLGVLSARVIGTQFGIATKISKHINWIRNTTYEQKQMDRCTESRNFRCGSECITLEKVCDGKRDCSDGSDEDAVHCSSGVSRPSQGVVGKKCTIPDGVGIFKVIDCRTPNGCTSEYSAPSFSTYNLTCPNGYGFARTDIESVQLVCNDGTWYPPIADFRCLTLCPEMVSKSLELQCNYLGSRVPCDSLLRPGTSIKINCKRQYKKPSLIKFANHTVCRRDGTIQHELSECIPICGVPYNLEADALISNGEEVKYAKYPWHVALYWKKELPEENIEYEYKCGGTLIDSNKVLTAAHCIWELSRNSIVDPKNLAVASGKLHSNWWIKDSWEQKVGVYKVISGKHYNGAKAKHSQDIAVLILNKDLQLSDYTMPACLDLDQTAGGIPKDQCGHVVGWGRVDERITTPSEVLMEACMDYLDLDTCRKKFEGFGFGDYLQSDKFCVLYKNGSGTQMGDSGGGLTFVHDQLYYVYGVVSIKQQGQNIFAAFTNVISHRLWLQDIINSE